MGIARSSMCSASIFDFIRAQSRPPKDFMAFNPLEYPLSLMAPHMVSDTSRWLGHVPFAFALVQMARPQSIVELGTHKGDSYLAFCQAVAALGLNTQCAAVDTWQGDRHSGM